MDENLLKKSNHFVNRDKIVNDIHSSFQTKTDKLHVITGMGGLGKTLTALEYLRIFGTDYESRYWWFESNNIESIEIGFRDLAETLDKNVDMSTGRAIELFIKQALLSDRAPWLLIFDNVNDLSKLQDSINRYLKVKDDPSWNYHILVTTRTVSELESRDEIKLFEMAPFEPMDTLEFIDISLSDPSDRASIELARLLGGHPLALSLAVSYIQTNNESVEDYVNTFKQAYTLEIIEESPDILSAILYTVVSIILENLSLDTVALGMIKAMSYFHSGATPESLFYEPTENSIDKVKTALKVLVKYNLVSLKYQSVDGNDESYGEENTTVNMYVHDAVQDMVRKKCKSSANDILSGALLILSNNMSFNFYNSREIVQINKPLLSHASTALNHYERMLSNGTPITESCKILAAIVHTGCGILENTLQIDLSRALLHHQSALSIRKSVYGNDHIDVGTNIFHIGRVYDYMGFPVEALSSYEEALRIFRIVHGTSHVDIVNTYNSMCNVFIYQKNYELALWVRRESINVTKSVYGDVHAEVAAGLCNLALILEQLNRFQESLEKHQESLFMYIQLFGNIHPAVGASLSHISTVYSLLGRYKDAMHEQEEALNVYISLYPNQPNHPHIVRTKENIEKIKGYQELQVPTPKGNASSQAPTRAKVRRNSLNVRTGMGPGEAASGSSTKESVSGSNREIGVRTVSSSSKGRANISTTPKSNDGNGSSPSRTSRFSFFGSKATSPNPITNPSPTQSSDNSSPKRGSFRLSFFGGQGKSTKGSSTPK